MTGEKVADIISAMISAPASVRDRVKVALNAREEYSKEIKVEGGGEKTGD